MAVIQTLNLDEPRDISDFCVHKVWLFLLSRVKDVLARCEFAGRLANSTMENVKFCSVSDRLSDRIKSSGENL